MAVYSLLDPTKPTMTIDSVSRAAAALGAEFEMRLLPRRAPARALTNTKRKSVARR
jgi:hypothetical protein